MDAVTRAKERPGFRSVSLSRIFGGLDEKVELGKVTPGMAKTRFLLIAFFFAGVIPGSAASHRHKPERAASTPRIIPGLGAVHHAVSTLNSEAQKFFDQGLACIFGFDYETAQRCFEQAVKLDPNLAMGWWGLALSLGPNINFPRDPAKEKAAYEAIQRALKVQEIASEPERGYINALAYRYSNDPKADVHQLDVAYRDAMARLVRSYPDDLDAATLYAESLMDLHPWRLWFHDGRPNEGTEEIIAVLESVLRRDPNHLGANHYYIHAVEGSPHPERGLASATRLESLAPAAGHLVHMPAHIQSQVGDHAGSVRSNQRAIVADKKFFAAQGKGLVAVMYHAHNQHFLAYSACLAGNYNEAKKAADAVAAIAAPHIEEMPEMEGFLSNFISAQTYIAVAFERWDDILKMPAPDARHQIAMAAWHFGRAQAYGARGNTAAAQKEQADWQQVTSKIKPEVMVTETNNVGGIFKIQGNLIAAAVAASQNDNKKTIDALTAAVADDDALDYSEPPGFFPPVRPTLGRALMGLKRFSDAEKVYRAALERSPRLPSALVGLRDSLQAQNRVYEARQIEQQIDTANTTSRTAGGARKRTGKLAD